ncbi:glycosyltransferase family 4 protein [Porphyromonas levii]|uniref:glycosyltransferase family 4 protein n=1 Tax=Porphyromonas levii TaxID=28114 RepID=UPI001BA99170|nr:glycosyltransferase family 4 protein [Porphyromonas levii]MBR8806255.1 D-inositol-3-phosphate glycosyltransferase [Porphyromonas levii]
MRTNKLVRVGTVASSLDFLEGQLAFYSSEYEVVAVANGAVKLREVGEREGVRTHEVKMARAISLWQDVKSLFSLITFFAKEKPLIVHSMTPKAGLLSMIAAWLTGVPIRIHTYTGLIFPTATGFKQKVLILMDRILCRCATRIIPEGQGVRKDLINYNITKKPLRVLLNGSIKGLDEEVFDPSRYSVEAQETFRQRFGISSGDFVFVFVGRLNRDKGINELVRAFRAVQEVRPCKLLLVGEREDDQNPILPETASEIERGEGIIFVGAQNDVRPFYAMSDALVFPSYREGFPNVPLEAGAMGLPSIVTDINGSNEIIIEGENGTIIPPRDAEALAGAMRKLLLDPDYVGRLAGNARHLITSRYNARDIWEATLALYREAEERVNRK